MLFLAAMLPFSRSSEGLRLLSLGQVREAIDAFNSALSQDPKDVKCLLGLARAQIATGESDEAIATLDKVFTLRPDHIEARSHKAYVLARKGDAKGIKDLEDVSKDRRAGYFEHLNYGLFLAGSNDEKAQKEFELALRSEAREVMPYLELGRIAERKKDFRGALRHYLKASEIAPPNNFHPFLMRARTHHALGEGTHAAAAMMEGLNRLPKRDPYRSDSGAPRELLTEAFKLTMDTQEFESAVKVAQLALEGEPDNATFQGWLNEALSASQKNAGQKKKPAAATFDATDASMVDFDATMDEAEKALFKKPPALEEVLAKVDVALRVKPNDPRANICKAVALAVKGQKQQALPFAQKALLSEDPAIKMEANQLIGVINKSTKK